MTEFMFGVGTGHLSSRAAKAAKKEGATLVNHVDPGCRCGWGYNNNDCSACKRHWFAGPNYGAPFNGQLAERVLKAVRAAATKKDLQILGA